MINYQGIVIRPPNEAESLILQVTLGCSDNRCIFCPAYKEKPFGIKPIEEIEEELSWAGRKLPYTRRIFLADGDALVLPQEKLLHIFDAARKSLPQLQRINLYGSAKSIEGKTIRELAELKERGLSTVYIGFETGDEEVYFWTKKYGSPALNEEACRKVKEAGLKVNATVILGLGGEKWSHNHAVNTAHLLNRAQPQQIAALTLMVESNTPLHVLREFGEFKELSTFEYLEELSIMIEHMQDFRCQFFSNHASNYLPIAVRFPKDRPIVLAKLKTILASRNEQYLRPDILREL
jgi:radical SAM superfamily enzyme YgiQ (UPF0313 family)